MRARIHTHLCARASTPSFLALPLLGRLHLRVRARAPPLPLPRSHSRSHTFSVPCFDVRVSLSLSFESASDFVAPARSLFMLIFLTPLLCSSLWPACLLASQVSWSGMPIRDQLEVSGLLVEIPPPTRRCVQCLPAVLSDSSLLHSPRPLRALRALARMRESLYAHVPAASVRAHVFQHCIDCARVRVCLCVCVPGYLCLYSLRWSNLGHADLGRHRRVHHSAWL